MTQLSDYLRENSLEFSIASFVSNLNEKLSNLAERINGKIDGFDFVNLLPENVDMDKINQFLDKYVKQ